MILPVYLLQTMFGVVTGTLLSEVLKASGRKAVEKQTKQQRSKSMAYDIIGYDDDDDDVGAIGEDEILDELISGAGTSEIIGASSAAARQKAKIARALAARKSGAVVQHSLSRRRRYPLGFTVTSVGAGGTATVSALPQNLYRAERLVIPSDIAFDLGVSDIKVGNTSQFAQNAEVPAAIFSEVAIDTHVGFDTAEVGNQISIALRNKTLVAVEFTASLIGTIAK